MVSNSASHHNTVTPSDRLPDPLEALEQELTELAGHLNAGNYRFLKLLAEFERRDGHVGWGIHSCAHWLSWKCGIGLVAARDKVRVARALETLPKLSDAMRSGTLSYCKIRALTRIATPENEELLVSLGETGTVSHVEKAVRLYRGTQRAQELASANAQYAERHVQCYVDSDGSVVIRGRLAPEQGALVMKALGGASDVLRDAESDSREGAPGEAWERRTSCKYIIETSRSDPAGLKTCPAKVGHQSEPSVAWLRGNSRCEAYTGSTQAA